jgi:hypothetical protein
MHIVPRFETTGRVIPEFAREGWLSPVEGTRLEIERGSDVTVGSNPTPSATRDVVTCARIKTQFRCQPRQCYLRAQWYSRAVSKRNSAPPSAAFEAERVLTFVGARTTRTYYLDSNNTSDLTRDKELPLIRWLQMPAQPVKTNLL